MRVWTNDFSIYIYIFFFDDEFFFVLLDEGLEKIAMTIVCMSFRIDTILYLEKI